MDESPSAVDLHLHTIASGGWPTIDVLPGAARVGGVDVVVATNHDRHHSEPDAPMVKRDGVIVVCGIELCIDAGDRRIDPPGHGFRERLALVEVIERLQRSHVERAREIVAAIEEETGARPEIDVHDGVGRLHVVRAVDASEAPYDYQGAFDELIDADGSCYVARELPTFDDDMVALRDVCNMVGLVHPFRYCDPAGVLELCADLDAVECYHPYGFDVEVSLVGETAERYGLLATGGSDTHDETLGRTGPPETDFVRFATVVDGF